MVQLARSWQAPDSGETKTLLPPYSDDLTVVVCDLRACCSVYAECGNMHALDSAPPTPPARPATQAPLIVLASPRLPLVDGDPITGSTVV